MNYKQVIIARKDLKMSPGKLAAQVSHASMAFLSHMVRRGYRGPEPFSVGLYHIDFTIDRGIYDGWIEGIFTKTVCEAKNKNQLMKAVEWAKEHNLKEGEDYFLIKDNCLTELTPEETDENGTGRTLTCIGFRPFPEDIANQLSHMYHLYV